MDSGISPSSGDRWLRPFSSTTAASAYSQVELGGSLADIGEHPISGVLGAHGERLHLAAQRQHLREVTQPRCSDLELEQTMEQRQIVLVSA